MKENKQLYFGNLTLVVASLFGGLFYFLADFGKAVVNLGGLVWFAVGVYLLICFLCGARRWFGIGAAAVVLIQLPIIVCCAGYLGVTPYFPFFGALPYASHIGLVIHPLLLVVAAALMICNFKSAVQADKQA